jgi:CBS domain containing-hemolysin-like protein
MIAGVVRLGNRPVRGVMTPRGEVDRLHASAGEEAARAVLARTAHSRLPVGEGSPDVPVALVHDEYGHCEGIVTPTGLTGAIVDALRSDAEPDEGPAAVQREDGSWLLAGWMPADEMAELLAIVLPQERGYHAAAGFVLAAAGRSVPGTPGRRGRAKEIGRAALQDPIRGRPRADPEEKRETHAGSQRRSTSVPTIREGRRRLPSRHSAK